MDEKKNFSPAFEAAQVLVDKAREQKLSHRIIRRRLDALIRAVSSVAEAKDVRGYVRNNDRRRFFRQWLELVSDTYEALEIVEYDYYCETPNEIVDAVIERAISLADNHKEAMLVWFIADEESELENMAFKKALSLCKHKDDVRGVCKEVIDAIGGWPVLDLKEKFILAFNRADELSEKLQAQSNDD